jgi:DDE family transposase
MLGAIVRWTHRHVKGLRKSQRTTLSYLVAGLIDSGSAGVAAIGRHVPGPAFVKHKIKRADRFLGNGRVDLAVLSEALLSWATVNGSRLLLALDWTDLPQGKKMLSLSVPSRGRALPVHLRVVDERRMWKSQNSLEEGLIKELLTLLPFGTKPVLLADRGFGRTRLMQQLKSWGISFVLRVQGVAIVRSEGRKRRLQTIPLQRGQTVWLRHVLYRDQEPVEVNVVLTWRRRMKESWSLVTDLEEPPQRIIALYGRRMQIEETFRDTKSVRWGFRFRHVRLSTCERYERLMMVLMLAYLFLMAVGAQAERDGRHRCLMANTARRRTLSWFTVGRACLRDYLRTLSTCVRFLRPLLVQL